MNTDILRCQNTYEHDTGDFLLKTDLQSIDGKESEKAIGFIKTYSHHLNDRTKRSMYEHITNITDNKLREVNKLNNLMKLINELCNI